MWNSHARERVAVVFGDLRRFCLTVAGGDCYYKKRSA